MEVFIKIRREKFLGRANIKKKEAGDTSRWVSSVKSVYMYVLLFMYNLKKTYEI